MGLLNSIGQGLSQAGYAAGDIFAKQAAAEQSSIMELERQKRLAEFQAELKNAPLKRYGAILKDEAGKDVTEPGKTEVIDAPSEFIGGENAGIENATGLINAPPTTRKRTQDEAMTAANARAMQDDPEAYAEYESRIGKPLREERKIDVAEAKNEAASKERAASEERRAKEAERKDATQRYIADLRSRDAEKRLEALLAKTGKSSDGTKEALNFIDGVRKDLANEASNLQRLYQADLGGKGKTEQAKIKAEYEPKFAAIEAKRGQIEADFNALREKVGLPGASAPAPSPTPDKAPAALPMPKEKSALQAGKVYQTSRGPAKWNGTAFEAQ